MSACRPPPAPLVVILGCTGTGKSELAVDLAARVNGEIVNADAMQMYKGLPIITNKISLEEQRSIPHHLLGNIGLDEETWIVGTFKREANRIIREIRSRGRLPIVVGGTHYYTKALLFKDSLVERGDDSLGLSPPQDNSSEYPILEDTTEAMWKKLKEVDPVMADRWHPNDRRKIRRSLEIFLTTGKRASDIYAEQQKRRAARVAVEEDAGPRPDPLLLWVHTEDTALKERLDRRVDKMLGTGLMDEITEMHEYLQSRLALGETVDFTKGIWQSIGFKEFQPYLQASRDEVHSSELANVKSNCLDAMKTATRRYARYQVKWIPKQLMPLLEQEGNLDLLYVLDSTDVARFSERVTEMAVTLTQRFLAGEDMPAPRSISDTAGDVLVAAEASSLAQDTRCRKHCEVCNAVLMTEDSWQKHVRGRAHRRNVRHAERTALVPVEEAQRTALVPFEGTEADSVQADTTITSVAAEG